MFRIYDGRETFYQWDLNQKLFVDDVTVNEVHFCTRACNEALVVEVYELDGVRVANVPNVHLQKAFDLLVYAYCIDANGEATKHCKTYKIIERSKPTGYIYTETEVKRYEDLEEAIAAVAEETKEYAKARYILPRDSGVNFYLGLGGASEEEKKRCDFSITFTSYNIRGNAKLNIPFEYDLSPVGFDGSHITNFEDFKPMIKNQILGKGAYSLDYIAQLVKEYWDSYDIEYKAMKYPNEIKVQFILHFYFASYDISQAFLSAFRDAIKETDTLILEYTKPVEKTVELIEA